MKSDRVGLGKFVAPTFLRDHLDQHWSVQLLRCAEDLDQSRHIVPVERPEERKAELFENDAALTGQPELFGAADRPPGDPLGEVATRNAVETLFEQRLQPTEAAVGAYAAEVVVQRADVV